MYCIKCGANNSDTAVFCQRCGQKLETTSQDSSTTFSTPPPLQVNIPASQLSEQPNRVQLTPLVSQHYQVDPTQYATPSLPYESSSYNVYEASNSLYPPPPPDIPSKAAHPILSSPKKSRRRFWIIMSIIVILLVIASSGLILYISLIGITPQRTLDIICKAMVQGDYQTAYNLFSRNDTQLPTTEQQFAQNNQVDNQSRNGLKNCTVSNVKQNGSSAKGLVTFIYGNGTSLKGLLTLIDENGVWKVINIGG